MGRKLSWKRPTGHYRGH